MVPLGRGFPVTKCPWCANPASDYDPPDPGRELCRPHLAEYEGLSLDGLDRMESEQYAEYADAMSWR